MKARPGVAKESGPEHRQPLQKKLAQRQIEDPKKVDPFHAHSTQKIQKPTAWSNARSFTVHRPVCLSPPPSRMPESIQTKDRCILAKIPLQKPYLFADSSLDTLYACLPHGTCPHRRSRCHGVGLFEQLQLPPRPRRRVTGTTSNPTNLMFSDPRHRGPD